jgi:hypothetical protein
VLGLDDPWESPARPGHCRRNSLGTRTSDGRGDAGHRVDVAHCCAAAVSRFGTAFMVAEHVRLYASLPNRPATLPRTVDGSRVRAS